MELADVDGTVVVVEVSSSEAVVVESVGWKVVVEISVVDVVVVVVGVLDVVDGAVVVVVEVVVKGSFLITLSKVALEDICSPC